MGEEDTKINEDEITTDETVDPLEVIVNAKAEAEAIIAKAKADARKITDKAKATSKKVTVIKPVKDLSDIVASGGTYEAVRKCYFGIKLYREGDPLQTEKGDIIPRHFKKVVRMVEVLEEDE
jgi:hypothetical protein